MEQYHKLEQKRNLREQLKIGLDVCITEPRDRVLRYVGEFVVYSMFANRQKYMGDKSKIDITLLNLDGWEADWEGRLRSRGALISRIADSDMPSDHSDFSRISDILVKEPEQAGAR